MNKINYSSDCGHQVSLDADVVQSVCSIINCLCCEYCLPPLKRVNGNLCGLKLINQSECYVPSSDKS